MYNLSFIQEAHFEKAVLTVLEAARTAKDKADSAKFGLNVIDPFGVLFEIAGFGLDIDTWLENERKRQAQKTLQNAIGSFHQVLIGHLPGWENAGVAGIVDAVNSSKKLVAEIKNKHNTVKGDNLKTVYDALHDAVMPKGSRYKGYTAYYVEILPKGAKRYDIPFTPSDNKTGMKRPENMAIKKIDGYSFYALATGQEDALQKVFKQLPLTLNKLLQKEFVQDKEIAFASDFFTKAYEQAKKEPKKVIKK